MVLLGAIGIWYFPQSSKYWKTPWIFLYFFAGFCLHTMFPGLKSVRIVLIVTVYLHDILSPKFSIQFVNFYEAYVDTVCWSISDNIIVGSVIKIFYFLKITNNTVLDGKIRYFYFQTLYIYIDQNFSLWSILRNVNVDIEKNWNNLLLLHAIKCILDVALYGSIGMGWETKANNAFIKLLRRRFYFYVYPKPVISISIWQENIPANTITFWYKNSTE